MASNQTVTCEEKTKPVLTCRDTGLTDEDTAILMRNPARSFIGISDDQRAFDQVRYQHRTRPWRDLKRRNEVRHG